MSFAAYETLKQPLCKNVNNEKKEAREESTRSTAVRDYARTYLSNIEDDGKCHAPLYKIYAKRFSAEGVKDGEDEKDEEDESEEDETDEEDESEEDETDEEDGSEEDEAGTGTDLDLEKEEETRLDGVKDVVLVNKYQCLSDDTTKKVPDGTFNVPFNVYSLGAELRNLFSLDTVDAGMELFLKNEKLVPGGWECDEKPIIRKKNARRKSKRNQALARSQRIHIHSIVKSFATSTLRDAALKSTLVVVPYETSERDVRFEPVFYYVGNIVGRTDTHTEVYFHRHANIFAENDESVQTVCAYPKHLEEFWGNEVNGFKPLHHNTYA
ncbi:hypothetical protein CYMTET_44341 [Cymbomonas tetramitiformis]|uniref:Uncharacterized protein n=1 Tax=Cymbomonas tetramitiformis TaxID=36881 RepID=A0AAE0C282_9CHLO|nr:hypothetical protein CYMTET_44341 [Cymbomonas tetramitiformis]|eukprot:gene161-286_t